MTSRRPTRATSRESTPSAAPTAPGAPGPRGARGARGAPGGTSEPQASLADLVAQALEGLERQGPPALEALCRAHPAEATALRARVEQLRAIGFVGAPAKDAPLPERIGDFRILSRLGGGGMGVVFLAEQEGLARQVALKLVRPDLLYFPGARERFAREVEAVARLAHPGIVPVFAGGEDNGIPYYAMERVRGASLEELLAALAGRDPSRLTGAQLRRAVELLVRKREGAGSGVGSDAGAGTSRHGTPAGAAAPGTTAPGTAAAGTASRTRGAGSAAPAGGSRAGRGTGSGAAADELFAGSWASACLRIAGRVAEALQHAHERGVLHRDIKPSNIMLTPDGRVLLLDFGLATAEGSERLTGSGAQLGSLAWMSPEQLRGEHATLDGRADVYSLGATLYELLSLRSPFTGGDAEATRQRILQGRLIPLRDLNAAVSRDAETVCQRAMDVERERRYADAASFGRDLDNALALRPVLARRPGPALKVWRWAQRNPARALASVLGAVLLVGGPVGYGVLQSRAADEQRRLNDELTAGRAKLQRSLDEETRQRQASERGYQRTLHAVDQMLLEVGSNDLENVPGFEDTRIALLERALSFYRDLATEVPGDVVPRREHARTERAIAEILDELGRTDEARETCAQTIATLRELVAQDPADGELQYLLASTLSLSGNGALDTGKLDAARAAYEESLGLLDALAARADSQPSWLRDQVVTLCNLALVSNKQGRDEEETGLYLRAAQAGARLTAAHPESVDYAIRLAEALKGAAMAGVALGRADESERLHREAHAVLMRLWPANSRDRSLRLQIVESASNLGLLLMSRADRGEALAVLQSGLDAARGLAQDFPRVPQYRQDAAVLAINAGSELGNQKRYAEAAALLEESCTTLAQLAQEQPDNVQYGYFLGAALSVASGLHLHLGDPARARREADDAVQHMRDAQAALAGSTEVGAQLGSALYQLADVQRATGDLDGALGTCEEASQLHGGRPDILFQGAEITGHLAAAARGVVDGGGGADGASAASGAGSASGASGGSGASGAGGAGGAGVTSAAQLAIAERAEELCLALLDEAVAKGFTDSARLRDAVFATLQGVQAFEALVQRAGPTP